MNLHHSDNYQVYYPIKNGYLNVKEGQSETVCLDMLENIIRACLKDRLKISDENGAFSQFSCLIIVPDLMLKKKILDLGLKRLKFKAAVLHQESVMSTYGLAQPSACIVDIGAEKISISCVDEGQLITESIIRKNYGSSNLTKIFHYFLAHPTLNK